MFIGCLSVRIDSLLVSYLATYLMISAIPLLMRGLLP